MFLDDVSTWSDRLVHLLDAEIDVLRLHEEEDSRLEGEKDPRYPITPPNRWDANRNDFLARVRALLANESVTAWHCTRMCPEDARSVRRHGLRPLSRRRVADRVRRRVNARDLTPEQAKLLRRNARLVDDGVCFYLETHSIKRGDARIFFEQWGGEAIFCAHEVGDLGEVLRRIGSPCIVESVLSTSRLPAALDLAASICRRFRYARGLLVGHEPEISTARVKPPVQPARVIEHGDPEFERLTSYSKWAE